MTATTEPAPRIVMLDIVRGVAVMGILAMNAVAFAMPQAAYFNPALYGTSGVGDLWSWALSFIFVDGKMRGLFSLLFGASMLLVIERANASGGNGGSVHRRRMFWLLIFGLAHFFLIWWGDILTGYALVGLVAYAFAGKSPRSLIKWSIAFFVLGLLLSAILYGAPLMLEAAAAAPNADPALAQQLAAIKAGMGASPAALATDVALHQGSYLSIVEDKLVNKWFVPPVATLMFAPETLAFMLLGMWGLKSGFLKGAWEKRRYVRFAAICLAIAIPAYALLAYAIWSSGFGFADSLAAGLIGGTLFRPVMTLGYAALILLIAQGGAAGWFGGRVAAAGRAAFTNYLGTSIVMTAIFYGYGLGLYGEVGRAELWLFILGLWAVMLLWSRAWLDRYRYGPLEWLWRSLARGVAQPMRKLSAAV